MYIGCCFLLQLSFVSGSGTIPAATSSDFLSQENSGLPGFTVVLPAETQAQ